jgi:hypothetical protein
VPGDHRAAAYQVFPIGGRWEIQDGFIQRFPRKLRDGFNLEFPKK